MTTKKKKDEELEAPQPADEELSNESTATDQSVDAPIHPGNVEAAKKTLEEAIEDSPEPDPADADGATLAEGETLNTSAHTEAGKEGSLDSTFGGVIVQSDPIYQTKNANPYTVVKMVGSPQPPPLEVADEWQPESAPVNRGASLIDPEKAQENDYLFTTGFYEAGGVPVCSKCGDKLRTDTYGHPICPIGDSGCPVIQASEHKASENTKRIDEINRKREEHLKQLDELQAEEARIRNAK